MNDTTAPEQAPESVPEPKRISIDRFLKTELRVAKVLEAERIQDTDKLLRLKVDIGEEQPRQLVAGIALAYNAEELIGRKIIVVANLKPAKIRGIESQGMLLAADFEGRPIIATFEENIPVGTLVR